MGTTRDTPEPDEVHAAIHQFPVKRARAVGRGRAVPPGPPGNTSSAREARAERVAALRQQIANGTYSPDPREVAREILKRGL
ncbi:MAG: flagellar biosynthesis anti-sigma factor FlgM [Anaerolineaceae bacterium]